MAGTDIQFTVYSHPGPNPWKVVILLEELGLTYKQIFINSETNEHRQKPYTDINPNGRMPSLVDHHNNDFTIWESGAILLYLVEKYDKAHKLSFSNFESQALAKQYLFYQVSGFGPYTGQLVWFTISHHEDFPSARDRYRGETMRILGVLDKQLEGKTWLVENKFSFADISFLPWLWICDWPILLVPWKETYKNVAAWAARMEERPSVKRAEELREPVLPKGIGN